MIYYVFGQLTLLTNQIEALICMHIIKDSVIKASHIYLIEPTQ